MDYHAHVYWQNEAERQKSLDLRPALTALGVTVGRIMAEPIGPHPRPSYQVNYSTDQQAQIEELLASSGLDVLLHEDTGDDVRDHTLGTRWLGHQLTLDLEWLEEYAKNKEINMQTKEETTKAGTCGCGRSPTGDCIGWHGLTEEEYQARLVEYQASQETVE